jgi:hypothetical protein
MRIKRSPTHVLGSKLFSRREVNSRLTTEAALDRGVFLGKLWALFGPPAQRAGGYEYTLRDEKTGLEFTAYVGPRGPSYGGELEQRYLLRPVVEALELLLEHTRPINCAFHYRADVELGGGTWVVGVSDGRSFDVPDRRDRTAEARVERRAALR